MKAPTQCILWQTPEALQDTTLGERFEVITTYADESHFSRDLLKCRECGQLYFSEFYEEVEWADGADTQYSTYIPVETDEKIERLKKASRLELLEFFPRLQKDLPKGAKEPTLRWIK